MLAGTVAAAVLLLESVTVTPPPDGGAPLNVTVPVEGEPPLTVAGERASALTDLDCQVSVALLFDP